MALRTVRICVDALHWWPLGDPRRMDAHARISAALLYRKSLRDGQS